MSDFNLSRTWAGSFTDLRAQIRMWNYTCMATYWLYFSQIGSRTWLLQYTLSAVPRDIAAFSGFCTVVTHRLRPTWKIDCSEPRPSTWLSERPGLRALLVPHITQIVVSTILAMQTVVWRSIDNGLREANFFSFVVLSCSRLSQAFSCFPLTSTLLVEDPQITASYLRSLHTSLGGHSSL